MTIKPGQSNAPYDIELSDGRKTYGLTLDSTSGNAVAISAATEDQLAVYINNVGKRAGDFDEQRTWKGGRGGEFYSDDPTRYFDSDNCWTMSNGHVTPTMQWKLGRGIRNEEVFLPGNVAWRSVYGTQRYLSASFTAGATFSMRRICCWIRRRGTPRPLTFALYSDSGGDPDALIISGTAIYNGVDDIMSVFFRALTDATTVTSGTTYHVVVYANAADTGTNHWDLGVDVGTSGGKQSSDGTTWSASGFTPYYRVSPAQLARKWWFFHHRDVLYAVDSKDDGTTASVLFMNGDRGLATGATSTTMTDSTKTWVVNRWAGAWVMNRNNGEVNTIISNTATELTTDEWDRTPSTADYCIYATEWWTEVETTGLNVVQGRPCSSNNVIYFPQGGGAAEPDIRRMHWDESTGDHEFDDDTGNKARYMIRGYKGANNKSVIWRSHLGYQVSYAPIEDWGTDLTFATDINIGDGQTKITGLGLDPAGNLRIQKEDTTWFLNSSNQAVEILYGFQATPANTNGIASTAHQKFFYFNWLWSVEREYGLPGSTTHTLDDIGWGWKEPSLPLGMNDAPRDGTITCLYPLIGWLFATVDAGKTGISSVVCWDGIGWHEILRGYEVGKRAYDVAYQPCEGTNGRLWTCLGGDDLVFQIFPRNKARPLDDPGVDYQHEGALYSGTIDMGTAAKLPKFIKALTLNTKNLDGGVRVEVDYQVDDNIGRRGYANWITAGVAISSPEEEIPISASNIRQFRYRLRLQTDTATTPPDVKGVVPSGFARSQFRRTFTLRLHTGKITTKNGTRSVPSDELIAWLYSAASFPGRVVMTSRYESLHNVFVVISPASPLYPITAKTPAKPEQVVMTITLMEVS